MLFLADVGHGSRKLFGQWVITHPCYTLERPIGAKSASHNCTLGYCRDIIRRAGAFRDSVRSIDACVLQKLLHWCDQTRFPHLPIFSKDPLPMPDSRPLARQKALVTGANSGIGEGVAMALGQAGADVIVNYVEGDDAAHAVVDRIKQFGVNAIAHKADVSSEDEVSGMFDRAVREFGTIDILVNNAGLQRDSAFADMTLEKWNTVLDVNLTGQFLCSRAAIREFLIRGVVASVSRAAGKIICMSSVHQVIPWAGHANYATSKGGIKLLMESMAQELAPKRIRVNGIAPGAIQTPINTSAWNTPEALKSLLTLIPYGRIGLPQDIARAAVWLASDDSDYVVGTTLFVDGGMTLYPGFSTNG
ncbi:MAG TPA: SDR family oxidoreductase [Rhizomicrobium sp.]